ncbi:hypothetical protein Poly30_50170 [Planctomycetes bacterium Poly30]|uniref:Uncharacterized protein n=1 Tax=Saltatorellus ferox TaxID=2528018 RepID=A0A518EZF6_9BACT|nr:hypothetical protein Poly30_50170 [Planctomycetes bacterium Poly30]
MNPSPFRRCPIVIASLASLVTTSDAQITLVQEGDMVGSIGACTRIDDVFINNQADWLVRLDTDAPGAEDEVVLMNGAVLFQQGSPVGIPSPAGATFSFLDTAHLANSGDLMVLFDATLPAGGTASLLYWNGALLLQEGVTPMTAPGVAPGSVWDSIDEAWANDSQQLLVGGKVEGSRDCLALLTLDAAGAIVSEELFAIDGATLPGHPTPVMGFSLARGRQALNNSGVALWFVDDDHTVAGGSTANDSWMYRGMAPLWREGDPMTTPSGSVFGSLSGCEVDLNDRGDHVFQGGRDSSFVLDVLVVNDTTIIAQEGAPAPNIPGGFTLTAIGTLTPVFLTERADVLWYGDWDDPDTSQDTAIFFNQTPLIREGVSTLYGNTITTIGSTDKTFALSDNGRYLIAELISDAPSDPTLNGAYVFDLRPNLGTSYCGPAAVNSSGLAGTIRAVGSTIVADMDLTLRCEDLARLAFSFVIVSRTQGFAMNPGGSAGNLCLAGAVGRAVSGIIANTGTAGELIVPVNLMSLPQPLGAVSVVPGDTWNFQAWFRDSVGGTVTSNFTNGVTVTFQ